MTNESLIIVLGSALAVIFVVWAIIIYNEIITRMNAVERAWTDVITQERQKNTIIPHMEVLLAQYKVFEEGVQTKIVELRTAIRNLRIDSVDTEGLANAEHKTAELLRGVNVAFENYPELKASEVFIRVMNEISEQQENIGAAIRIFNQNVEFFNNGIQTFPNSLVNQLLNKKSRMNTFEDSSAQASFEYKPNIH